MEKGGMRDDGEESAAAGAAGGPARSRGASSDVAAGMVIAALIFLALHAGRGIVLPQVVAFRLAFVLAPPVSWMARRGVPRPVGAALVLAVMLVAIAGFGLMLSAQVRGLAADLPTYQSNILHKLTGLRESINAPGVFSRALETLDRVQREVVERAGRSAPPDVQMVQFAPGPGGQLQQALAWGAQALEPLATLGIVLFFVFVALVERRDLRDR